MATCPDCGSELFSKYHEEVALPGECPQCGAKLLGEYIGEFPMDWEDNVHVEDCHEDEDPEVDR